MKPRPLLLLALSAFLPLCGCVTVEMKEKKAARLVMRYRAHFDDMFATFHPAGLPNETAGKGSNEAWAAREARIRIIENVGESLDRYIGY